MGVTPKIEGVYPSSRSARNNKPPLPKGEGWGEGETI